MTKFELKCYPQTKSERTVLVEIGEAKELGIGRIAFGYRISSETGTFESTGLASLEQAQAKAMLRAVAFGNGGFPLEHIVNQRS